MCKVSLKTQLNPSYQLHCLHANDKEIIKFKKFNELFEGVPHIKPIRMSLDDGEMGTTSAGKCNYLGIYSKPLDLMNS